MNQPKITIVTVCFNSVDTIEKTIRSVVEQTYENIEYIIVDGASKDGTLDIINKYKDKIAIVVSEPDRGIYDAMNKGIALATGEWIHFRNSGDVFSDKNVLSDIFNCYKDNGEDLIVGNMLAIRNEYKIELKPDILSQHYFERMPFLHPSTFIRCKTHQRYLFPKQYKLSGDYWSMLAILTNGGEYCYIDRVISEYDDERGASKDRWKEGLMENIELLKEYGAPETYIISVTNQISQIEKRNFRLKYIPFYSFYYKYKCKRSALKDKI